ncbi:MAG: SDR family NAD(P)-dependent oxidoreductase, partial [Candidatus Thorarchaeota archaeon]
MANRLKDKVAIIIGAGQQPGDTIGNGRAMSILFAREGAKVMLVDKNHDFVLKTKTMIEKEGGECFVFEADITIEDNCRRIAEKCVEVYGRIDILVNNVGIGSGDRKLV